jgi:hypothetical protein
LEVGICGENVSTLFRVCGEAALVKVCLMVLAVGVAGAWGQRDVSLNPESVLREIDALEKKQRQVVQGARGAAMQKLKAGAVGGIAAASLYEQAVGDTQFEGRRDRASAFGEWKKANAGLLRTSEFQTAVALHLRYLMLGMERRTANDPAALAQPSLDYAADLARLWQAVDALDKPPKPLLELLEKSANAGIFARWLALEGWLYTGNDWEPAPGNIEGILEKNVRKVWRKTKNQKLISVHDFQLDFEAARVASGRLAHKQNTFHTIRRPRLVFARANDIAALGFPNHATTEILSLARNNPQHPDFELWTTRIRELLQAPAPTPAPTPASP